MKKIYILLVFACVVFFYGCEGKVGPAGPQGTAGSPAPNTFQTMFQNGVYPNASYSSEVDTWVSGGAPTTPEVASPYLQVNTGSGVSSYSRVLVRFDNLNLPTNATVIAAEVWLKTRTNTNVGSAPVTIGVHNLETTLIPGCIWTANATWNQYNGIGGWNLCDGDSSAEQLGYINSTVLSKVVFTSANSGQSQIFKWSIPAATVQNWLSGNNNGLVFKSEGEFNEPSAGVDFYPYNDSTAANRALLIVTYQ